MSSTCLALCRKAVPDKTPTGEATLVSLKSHVPCGQQLCDSTLVSAVWDAHTLTQQHQYQGLFALLPTGHSLHPMFKPMCDRVSERNEGGLVP